MAQDTWINITLSGGTLTGSEKVRHSFAGGAAPGGDVTFSHDSAKFASNLNALDVFFSQLRLRLVGSGFK